jgi:bromodomain-containing factor 1
LLKLYDLATTTFPHLKSQKEQTFAAPTPVQAPAPKSKAAAKNKKNKPMSKSEQERRIAQLNELRAQAGRQASGSQEPMESIEGNGNGRASTDPAPNRHLDSDDEESSEEE